MNSHNPDHPVCVCGHCICAHDLDNEDPCSRCECPWFDEDFQREAVG